MGARSETTLYSPPQSHWSYAIVFAAGTLMSAAGCGRSDTVSISGHVTLDKKSLTTGDIELIPDKVTGGPTVGGEIVEGQYDLPAVRGPRRGGKYRVEIRSLDRNSGSTKHPLSRGKMVFSDLIPPAYNTESQLSVSVPEDVSEVEQDFDLQSSTKTR
jgi:hypothetical protein